MIETGDTGPFLKRSVRGNVVANCWRIKRGIVRQASIECTFNSVHPLPSNPLKVRSSNVEIMVFRLIERTLWAITFQALKISLKCPPLTFRVITLLDNIRLWFDRKIDESALHEVQNVK